MSTVEKRHDPGEGPIPPEKRQKVDDLAMELQGNSNLNESKSAEEAQSEEGSSDEEEIICCEICYVTGHDCRGCPYRSIGMGFACKFCYGPCKKKDGDGDTRHHRSIEVVKQCVICGNMGNHWADDCPSLIEQPPRDEYLSEDVGF